MDKKQKQKILDELGQILSECEKQIARAQKHIAELSGAAVAPAPRDTGQPLFRVDPYPGGEEVIEGVFDGKDMIAKDGTPYQVPENYASKSKLVEGDLLKLTVTPEGRFIYKQIGPIERENLRGVIQYHDEEDRFTVLAEGNEYVILKASVTYFKGGAGDHAVILVPKGRGSNWAALGAIIREGDAGGVAPTMTQPVSVGQLEEI